MGLRVSLGAERAQFCWIARAYDHSRITENEACVMLDQSGETVSISVSVYTAARWGPRPCVSSVGVYTSSLMTASIILRGRVVQTRVGWLPVPVARQPFNIWKLSLLQNTSHS